MNEKNTNKLSDLKVCAIAAGIPGLILGAVFLNETFVSLGMEAIVLMIIILFSFVAGSFVGCQFRSRGLCGIAAGAVGLFFYLLAIALLYMDPISLAEIAEFALNAIPIGVGIGYVSAVGIGHIRHLDPVNETTWDTKQFLRGLWHSFMLVVCTLGIVIIVLTSVMFFFAEADGDTPMLLKIPQRIGESFLLSIYMVMVSSIFVIPLSLYVVIAWGTTSGFSFVKQIPASKQEALLKNIAKIALICAVPAFYLAYLLFDVTESLYWALVVFISGALNKGLSCEIKSFAGEVNSGARA